MTTAPETPTEVAAALAEVEHAPDIYPRGNWWPLIEGTADGDTVTLRYGGPDLDRTVVLRVVAVLDE